MACTECTTADWAASVGHLDCLQRLFPGSPALYAAPYAAQGGYLECLRYLHKQGCPWDQKTTQWAAANGQLACLHYAHEQGCPWDEKAVWMAALNGRLPCLRYAADRGCPRGERVCTILFDGCACMDCTACPARANKRADTGPALAALDVLPTVLVGLLCDFACET